MTTTTSTVDYVEIEKRRVRRFEAGLDEKQSYLLADMERELGLLDEQLVNAADRLADRMARLTRAVELGHTVNSLGEVQSQGLEVDRLCALRQAASDNLVRVTHALGVDVM